MVIRGERDCLHRHHCISTIVSIHILHRSNMCLSEVGKTESIPSLTSRLPSTFHQHPITLTLNIRAGYLPISVPYSLSSWREDSARYLLCTLFRPRPTPHSLTSRLPPGLRDRQGKICPFLQISDSKHRMMDVHASGELHAISPRYHLLLCHIFGCALGAR